MPGRSLTKRYKASDGATIEWPLLVKYHWQLGKTGVLMMLEAFDPRPNIGRQRGDRRQPQTFVAPGLLPLVLGQDDGGDLPAGEGDPPSTM